MKDTTDDTTPNTPGMSDANQAHLTPPPGDPAKVCTPERPEAPLSAPVAPRDTPSVYALEDPLYGALTAIRTNDVLLDRLHAALAVSRQYSNFSLAEEAALLSDIVSHNIDGLEHLKQAIELWTATTSNKGRQETAAPEARENPAVGHPKPEPLQVTGRSKALQLMSDTADDLSDLGVSIRLLVERIEPDLPPDTTAYMILDVHQRFDFLSNRFAEAREEVKALAGLPDRTREASGLKGWRSRVEALHIKLEGASELLNERVFEAGPESDQVPISQDGGAHYVVRQISDHVKEFGALVEDMYRADA